MDEAQAYRGEDDEVKARQPEGPLLDEIARAEDLLQHLDKECVALRHDLTPILRPDEPDSAGVPLLGEATPCSPLLGRVRDLNHALGRRIQQVVSIRARLDDLQT